MVQRTACQVTDAIICDSKPARKCDLAVKTQQRKLWVLTLCYAILN